MLEGAVRLVLSVPRNVYLAILASDGPCLVDKHVRVVAMAIWGEFGVTETETNPKSCSFIKERLNISVRHLTLVVVIVTGDVFGEPPGEERR